MPISNGHVQRIAVHDMTTSTDEDERPCRAARALVRKRVFGNETIFDTIVETARASAASRTETR